MLINSIPNKTFVILQHTKWGPLYNGLKIFDNLFYILYSDGDIRVKKPTKKEGIKGSAWKSKFVVEEDKKKNFTLHGDT